MLKLAAYAHSLDEIRLLAEGGFKHVALHPMLFPAIEIGFIPNDQMIESVKAEVEKYGLEPTDLVTFNAWNALGLSGAMEQLPSGPSDPEYEILRKRGVEQFKKLIGIARKLGCRQIYSQMGGRPLYHLDHEEAWIKSVTDLSSTLEENEIQLAFMPHPGDFIEESDPCVDLISERKNDWLKYIYVVPHTFVLAGRMQAEAPAMIEYASRKGVLSEIHMADSIRPVQMWIRDHLDIQAYHNHLEPGKGALDIPAIVRKIVEIDFQGPVLFIPYRYGISDKSFTDLSLESKRIVEKILEAYSK